ncbi:uncharacterized protein LOC132741446 [Ruditapes philippinarum]|uniref:uncharacterized protein LOC132741446 n=1 Tax=Ruditapes philippinarum TaxID=129788 RepID=UPI00295C25BF|nr:uncharacterized protein LOC132741446 [Ruditapes philippinarum]
MATNKDGEHISQSLSEVLNDIGVNEGEVLKKRRTQQLCESMETISWKVTGRNSTFYHLGSQSEGTTTVGLQSDIDTLGCNHDVNVMQDWSEWEPGKVNYLMIQDENTTPGYCFLQKPISEETHSMTSTHMPDLKLSTDRKGRILLKNTNINVPDFENHGPAFVRQGHHASKDKDMVLALPCKSWPQSASSWIERQDIGGKWPTKEMRRYAASTECFVVATGSKISLYPELEWRISTCLAERCLMFDLNITQIRCYVLMKMIFKYFKNTKGEVNISSYMCKAVLFHCIKDTEPCIWKEGNLFTCLTYCLQELNSCVQNDHCSHFIISENNLMAGQFTSETKHELSKLISDIIESDGHWLCRIDIDDLGRRLQVKLNLAPKKAYRFQSSLERRALASASNYFNLAYQIGINHIHILLGNPNTDIRVLKQSVEKLDTIRGNVDNRLEHAASNFLAHFLFATYGSALASSSISENNQVSTDALDWLTAGLNSDMSSSRLKLASVLYRTGDMEKAEQLLRHVEKQFYSNPAVPICICCERHQRIQPLDLLRVCAEQAMNVSLV